MLHIGSNDISHRNIEDINTSTIVDEISKTFARNFLDCLNDFILSKNIWLSNSETSLKSTVLLKQFSEDSETEPPTNSGDQELSINPNSKDKSPSFQGLLKCN